MGDLRIAVRGLLRNKGFAFASALTLALGIGAATTIFSVVYGVLLRPLPYRHPDRLVVIQGEKDFAGGPRLLNYSPSELEEFSSATSLFSSMALSSTASLVLQSDAGAQPVGSAVVSGAFFDTLNASPRLGRVIGDEAEPVIVISDRFWRKTFASDPNVIGRSISLTDRENIGRTYSVVGVLPPEFQYPRPQIDVWRPLAFVRAIGDDRVRQRNRGGAEFIARMRDGVTLDAARADAVRANDILKTQFTTNRLGLRPKVTSLPAYVTGTIGPALWILMGAVTLVLLVATTNVAALILARQSSRAKEISVRMALGSPRRRLVAFLLAESAIIAIAGCAIGVMIAAGSVRVLHHVQPARLPRLDAIAVDWPVVLFAVIVAAAGAVAAGSYPAIMATRTDAMLALRAGSRGPVGSSRVRSLLVVVEIAASIVLLVGAALLSRSLASLLRSDLGVNTERVMVAQVDLGLGRVVPGARQVEMMDALRQRVALIPSVRIAAYGSALPPETEVLRMSFTVKDAETGAAVEHIMTAVPASPEYFAALQIRLARGRLFTSADTAASPGVGILNREAARRLFGEADPLGRILPHSEGDITIVGVVDNVKYTGIGTPTESVLYRPFSQQPIRFGAVLAKTAGDPALITNALREAIRSYDPGISVGGVQPLTTWVSDAAAEPRFRTMLSSSIAVLAMILAIVGLYALIAYSATQRTPEIGVRIAVGARGADIVKLLLFEGVRVALIGITIGLAGSLWLMRLLNAFLYGVTATDPVAFAGMAATVLTLALVASYIPARRAARTDPTRALRTE